MIRKITLSLLAGAIAAIIFDAASPRFTYFNDAAKEVSKENYEFFASHGFEVSKKRCFNERGIIIGILSAGIIMIASIKQKQFAR
jgi:hypothetical protein